MHTCSALLGTNSAGNIHADRCTHRVTEIEGCNARQTFQGSEIYIHAEDAITATRWMPVLLLQSSTVAQECSLGVDVAVNAADALLLMRGRGLSKGASYPPSGAKNALWQVREWLMLLMGFPPWLILRTSHTHTLLSLQDVAISLSSSGSICTSTNGKTHRQEKQRTRGTH